MAEFIERLQAALGGAYRVERELGGGMSRVFLAEETLARRVVIKVPPDLAQEMRVDRFKGGAGTAERGETLDLRQTRPWRNWQTRQP